jgi:3D (Asp-Asp-Asp) domain-containing protein
MIGRTQTAFTGMVATAVFALGCGGLAPPEAPREAPRAPAPKPVPQPPLAPAEPEPATAPVAPEEEELLVMATAYNSLPSQGTGDGTVTAWGDRLAPGMKTIAVSHDLLALGLSRGVRVRIEGLAGHYTVLDRLPRRWSRRIDIYMGTDVKAARAWGKREVQIRWVRAT